MSRTAQQPLVHVTTPVYNGAAFLRECIESVLAQTYSHWLYTIVDNCSTDRTGEIAAEYAASDPRIRIHRNDTFLPSIDNHNTAYALISPESKYCKPLMADDWLFPQCITEMVRAAERHPSIGLVCAYAIDGTRVVWGGLPYPGTLVPGREICRATLLGAPYVFGTPTSQLIRADLIRKRRPFQDPSNLHSDFAACLDILQESDFGFVHQVLTFHRVHADSMTSRIKASESVLLGNLTALVKFGPVYLTADEFQARRAWRLRQYYGVLAKNLLRLRESAFWELHRRRLCELGLRLERTALARALLAELARSASHPIDTCRGAASWWPIAARRMWKKKHAG